MFSYFACITNANLLPYDCISISKGLINHIVILGMKIKKKATNKISNMEEGAKTRSQNNSRASRE